MKRMQGIPRADWSSRVEEQGLVYHRSCHPSDLTRPYWDESVHYVFQMEEVLRLEEQVEELHRMCMEAVEFVVAHKRYAEFAIPPHAAAAIEASWKRGDPHIMGRFDVRYDGQGPLKLLEYNADTPTSLLESAVIQWFWLRDVHPSDDQWNSLHERLIESWKRWASSMVHFAWTNEDETGEEAMTIAYLEDTAQQAGVITRSLAVEDIGWDVQGQRFVDVEESEIDVISKLYPWEWIVDDGFGQHVTSDLATLYPRHRWVEPIWKMVLSNKMLLAILWEMYPDHPNLLPAYLDGPRDLDEYIAKPLLGREGASMKIAGTYAAKTPGEYGAEGYVYQAFDPLPTFDGQHPVLGCWIVDDEAAGLGIRETESLITDDTSSFVPHRIATS